MKASHFDAVIVGSGFGGSLIYANVMLRKVERWFVQEDIAHGGYTSWPVTRAELEPHYDRVVDSFGEVFNYPNHYVADRSADRKFEPGRVAEPAQASKGTASFGVARTGPTRHQAESEPDGIVPSNASGNVRLRASPALIEPDSVVV